MLDVDAIVSPQKLDGAGIYVYGTGMLRVDLLNSIGATERLLQSYSLSDLEKCWSVENLLAEFRVCELGGNVSGAHLKQIETLVTTRPAEPTLILVRGSRVNSVRLRQYDVAIFEEPRVTPRNILKTLRFLAERSDLDDGKCHVKTPVFQSHFRNWIDQRGGSADLLALQRQYERVVLLASDPVTGELNLKFDGHQEIFERPTITSSLIAYLNRPGIFARSSLVAAIGVKSRQGSSRSQTLGAFLAANSRMLDAVLRGSAYRKSRISPSAEAILLWCAITLTWSSCFADATPSVQTDVNSITVEVDRLCRQYEARLRNMFGDPLHGRWSTLRSIQQQIVKQAQSAVSKSQANEMPKLQAWMLEFGEAMTTLARAKDAVPWTRNLFAALEQIRLSVSRTELEPAFED